MIFGRKMPRISLPVLVRLIRHWSLVPLLFTAGRPAAVAGSVVTAVVGIAVNGVFKSGPLSHVFKEVLEDKPSFADLNTKFHVVSTMLAAVFHRLPRFVSRGNLSSACFRVLPGMPMVKIGLPSSHIGTLFAGPRSGVSFAGASCFTFSHTNNIHLVRVGGK